MNWVKNHTCKNCKYSAKVDGSKVKNGNIYVLSDDDDAVNWCIDQGREIPDVDHCTCFYWKKDKQTSIKEKFTEDGLKYCSCGHEPRLFQDDDFYRSGFDGWHVYCQKCGKRIDCNSTIKSDAIRMWNWNVRMSEE